MSKATNRMPAPAASRRSISSFTLKVIKADRGRPQDLLDDLLQRDNHEYSWLAWLIQRKVPRNGRPPGPSTPERSAIECTGYLLRIGKRVWRERHGLRRAPSRGANQAPVDRIIRRVIELLAVEEFPHLRGLIESDRLDEVIQDVKQASNMPPRPELVEYVGEFLDDVRREVLDIARE
jgi:hypothetical protein